MKVTIYFDYVCPYCYISYRYLVALKPNYPQLELDYRPCEAHPAPEEPFTFREQGRFWQESILPTAAASNVEINLPVLPVPYSGKANEGFFFLQEHGGNVELYHDLMFRAVFVEQQNIANPALVAAIAVKAGADEAAVVSALAENRYSAAVTQANKEAWEERRLEAIPSYFAEDKALYAQPKIGVAPEALRDFLDNLQ